ncbi:hypothetical protein [Chitinophaga nivalis]|uniref:Uncharacterized protein n=2 Tax=Chitinophaga nivalis TaxID=2991709 RepID=A0ABT3IQD7_9BACT|nr:hypothetical protein [Chitinophaga nivalis]MCW3486191.1 hypothetical protein [Chitinophaga nivalis]
MNKVKLYLSVVAALMGVGVIPEKSDARWSNLTFRTAGGQFISELGVSPSPLNIALFKATRCHQAVIIVCAIAYKDGNRLPTLNINGIYLSQ